MASRVTYLLLSTIISVAIYCAQGQLPYYGKLLNSGWGVDPVHSLSGDIYAVNENKFQVIGFSFDGNAPGAVFTLGTDKPYDDVKGAASSDPTATIIANPQGTFEKLRIYDNENIVLTLPDGKVLTDYTYISVWCRNVSVYFGGFDIPRGFVAPQPQGIGQLTFRAHAVSSGNITVVDDKTIIIKNLRYDGQGPDAYFYVGASDRVSRQTAPYGKIPNEAGDSGVIKSYSGVDVTLTLPDSLSFTQLKWFSIYCYLFRENFGDIFFPANLNVPPALETKVDRKSMNCEPLSNKLQVSWLVEDNTISIELAGQIERNTDYIAFGLSGNEFRPSMIGADVVVADWKDGATARAIDYHITQYSQCAGNGGVCPDTATFNTGGVDNADGVIGEITDGIVRIQYKRLLITGDSNDKDYKVDGTPQHIVWSIGPLNTKNEAAKHYTAGGRITIPKTINFGREVADNCPGFVKEAEVEKPDFTPHHIYGKEGSTTFTAEIGQAGSQQGYKALTGMPSWGIAWYINGILIPELHLKRGVSYTFRVGGGTNPSQGAKYHPLYFTDDIEGGFQQKENPIETIYNGTVDGVSVDKAVGGYCEWKLSSAAVKAAEDGHVSQCFEEFKEDLSLSCDEPNQYTEFIWTPDSTTPDTLYYQCYTHKSLGWKVHVYDELPTNEIADVPCSTTTIIASTTTTTTTTTANLLELHASDPTVKSAAPISISIINLLTLLIIVIAAVSL